MTSGTSTPIPSAGPPNRPPTSNHGAIESASSRLSLLGTQCWRLHHRRFPGRDATATLKVSRSLVGRHDESSSNPNKSMEGGLVDELLDVTVERPVLEQLQVEVGRPWKIGSSPV